MERLAAAHEQYEAENGFTSESAEIAAQTSTLQYASILKRKYLQSESGAEMCMLVDQLHDQCMVEQLIARCFQDKANVLDHLNDFLKVVAGHADTMAMKDAESADHDTIMEAL